MVVHRMMNGNAAEWLHAAGMHSNPTFRGSKMPAVPPCLPNGSPCLGQTALGYSYAVLLLAPTECVTLAEHVM